VCGGHAAFCQITLHTCYIIIIIVIYLLMILTSNIKLVVALNRIEVLRAWMRPIVTDRVAWSVCRSVTFMTPAKTAEPIEMPFGKLSGVGPLY